MNPESNYFKINRALLSSSRWLSEPFTRGQAWVDLCGLAQHTDSYFRVRGVRVDLKRGQLGYSQVSLAERWKWSRDKVRRFLKELETQEDIIQQNNEITTVITICKYNIYQGDNTAEDTTDNTANNTTNKQQKNSRKTHTTNDTKDTNENNDNSICSPQNPKFQKPTIEMVIEYAQASVRDLFEIDCRAFFDYYTANGWRVGKSPMKDWHAALRNWARNKRQFGSKSSTTPPVQRGSGNVCPL